MENELTKFRDEKVDWEFTDKFIFLWVGEEEGDSSSFPGPLEELEPSVNALTSLCAKIYKD